jgi:hypothetical protein
MKLTWFGGTTLRIHIGGAILVADAERAPHEVDRGELVAGADRTFTIAVEDPGVGSVDPEAWRPRRHSRAIDEAAQPPVLVLRIGSGAVLVDAVGEPPLVLMADTVPPHMGRWAGDAVVVIFGAAGQLMRAGMALLTSRPPRLIALAASEAELDRAIEGLSPVLGETGLMSLEPGLGIEV